MAKGTCPGDSKGGGGGRGGECGIVEGIQKNFSVFFFFFFFDKNKTKKLQSLNKLMIFQDR